MTTDNKKYPFTQNREISWLKFNQRVLEEASDPSVELLERLKFVAIFTSNLDEFFQVRCGSLGDMALVDNSSVDQKSGMHPSDQLEAIWKTVSRLYPLRDNIHKGILKTMKEVQIFPVSWKNMNKKQTKQLGKYFETQLKPLLAPQIIDFHHPFPFLISQELYIFFEIIEDGHTKYGIVPVPDYIDRLIYLNEEKTEFILAEDLIFHNLEKIFPKNKIPFKTIIRVTRNADINLDERDIEEDEDYRQYMKKILKRRNRLTPVRLEIFKYSNEQIINYLCRELHLSKNQVFISKQSPLDMSFVFSMIEALPEEIRNTLSFKEFSPQTSSLINPEQPVIPQVLDHDILLSYPYQNIDEFIRLLKEAAESPDVISVKITIYRLAKHSRIVHYLCRAAENGKEVTVLMELRARFDEQNNIYNAERLEEAGCNVIYGFPDYKVHSKIMEITMKTADGIRTITQIGTGNYNEKTSHQYTDFSYITSRDDIGHDATEFFRNMLTSNLHGHYDRLLVSPRALKQAVMDELDEQILLAKEGKPAMARFKMNSITDLDIIAKLAEASKAGVKIQMVVRGICCLLPGLQGQTSNIEIHSIVGRYLEHGRIYIFGTGPSAKVYISSADFMTRNTERRVEVAVPIDDPSLKKELIEYFTVQFQDDVKGRKMLSDGSRTRVTPAGDEPLDSQKYFMQYATEHPYIAPPVQEEQPALRKQNFLQRWLSRYRKSKASHD